MIKASGSSLTLPAVSGSCECVVVCVSLFGENRNDCICEIFGMILG